MIFAFIGWLLLSAAVAFGSYRFTRGNVYYTGAFTAMTLFAPPIGATAFALFLLLRTLMPTIREIPVVPQEAAAPEPHTIQKNLHYAKQLEEAEGALKLKREALEAVEAKINAIDPKETEALKRLETLEAEKAECAVAMIAAEEAYDRLRKLQH